MKEKILKTLNIIALFIRNNLMYVIGSLLIIISVIIFILIGNPEIIIGSERVRIDGKYVWVDTTRPNAVFYVNLVIGLIFSIFGLLLIVFEYIKRSKQRPPKKLLKKKEMITIEQQLLNVKRLFDNKVITENEYNEMRHKILEDILK